MFSRLLIKLLLLAAIGTIGFTIYVKRYGSAIDPNFTVKEMTVEEYNLYKSKQIADYIVQQSQNLSESIKAKSPFSSEEQHEPVGRFDAPELTERDRACNKAITAYFSDKSKEAKERKDRLCLHNKVN